MEQHYVLFLTISFLVGLGIGIIFSRKAYGFFIAEIKTDLRHIRKEVDHMRTDVSYFTEGHGPSLTHDHEPSHVEEEIHVTTDLDDVRQILRDSNISEDTIDSTMETINNTISNIAEQIGNIGNSFRFPRINSSRNSGGSSYSYTTVYHGPRLPVDPSMMGGTQPMDPSVSVPNQIRRRGRRQQTTNPEHPELDL